VQQQGAAATAVSIAPTSDHRLQRANTVNPPSDSARQATVMLTRRYLSCHKAASCSRMCGWASPLLLYAIACVLFVPAPIGHINAAAELLAAVTILLKAWDRLHGCGRGVERD
jgi:hypothetical protein